MHKIIKVIEDSINSPTTIRPDWVKTGKDFVSWMNIRKDQVIAKQNPNKGNTSSEDMLRMAKTVRELRIPLLEAKSKKEIKK